MKKKNLFFMATSLFLLYRLLDEFKNKKHYNPKVTAEELNNKEKEDWKHDFFYSGEVRLHYITKGEGPLVILLHGYPESCYCWEPQIPELSKKFKVVALDMRGYNLSDKPFKMSDYRLGNMVDDIKNLIKELGYDKASVVAHDWGGAIAWWFAMIYPDLLEKLVILNSPHPITFLKALRSGTKQLFHSWYMMFFQIPLIPEFFMSINNYDLAANRIKNTSTMPDKAFKHKDIQRFKEIMSKPGHNRSAINYYRAVFTYGSPAKPKNIETPTLILWGEKDEFILKEFVNKDLEKYVKNLEIKYYPEASHWINREIPEKVNKELVRFLS